MAQLLRLSAGMIDLATGAFDRDGQTVQLIGKELALLRYFARKADVVVPREELYTEVWGYAPQVQSRTLDVTLHKLRTKIELDPSNPVHLLTIVGEGTGSFPCPSRWLATRALCSGEGRKWTGCGIGSQPRGWFPSLDRAGSEKPG